MPKMRKRIFLNADKVCRIHKILKTKTDIEAINKALDIVLANADVHNKIAGLYNIK